MPGTATTQPGCLICGAPIPRHGICNGCYESGRRLDERPLPASQPQGGYRMSEAEQLAPALEAR